MQWQLIQRDATCIIADCTLPLTVYRLIWFRRGDVAWLRAFATKDALLDWRVTPGTSIPAGVMDAGIAMCRSQTDWDAQPKRKYTKRKPKAVG